MAQTAVDAAYVFPPLTFWTGGHVTNKKVF